MLSALIWLPIAGAILVALLPASPEKVGSQSRNIAFAIASALLGLSFYVLTQFDLNNPGMQMQESLSWISTLGLNYRLGLDGLSLPLIVLNSFLTWIVLFSTKDSIRRPRLFNALVLLVNGGIAGAFLAQNLLLFLLFYEIELIPLYLMIAIWGGKKRDYAAIKFLLYTAVSGILILASFLAIALTGGTLAFDYDTLQAQVQLLPLGLQTILLITLLIGFGIKAPLVPFHTWLPDTYVEADAPVAILLGGVLAKLGTYGLFRFCLGLFPGMWANLAPYLAVWAAITTLYGAVTAIAQKDIKRMVAYSSIGHMGYVLLAGAALTPLSIVGGVSQMVAHGLILALLFYLVGIIEEKVGTRELDVLNGLLNPIRGLPLTSSLLILGGMASAGIPGLVGFVSEFLVFQGSYEAFPIPTLLCVVGTGLTAVYFVILLNRTCFGRLDSKTAYYPNIKLGEQAPALILTALIFFLGIQPVWLVRWSEKTTAELVATVPAALSQQEVASVDTTNPVIARYITKS